MDKVGEDWKAVRHNIAMVAVKRYLSNILTDYEKQRTYALALGEFVPNPKDLAHSLWNDDVMVPYQQNKADITAEKEKLFPMITKDKKLIISSAALLTEANAFQDEKVIILGGDLAVEETAEPKEKLWVQDGSVNDVQTGEEEQKEVEQEEYMPSNLNFLAKFRKIDRELGFQE